jgi:hypothetical protein
MNDAITVCMTMGRRPDLLRQTFESLGAELDGLPVLAINDFGDSETNEMFAQVCPQGRRIDLGRQVGHHPAVDALYGEVRTPFIFHLEDDWGFHRQGFLGQARALLQSDPGISIVCLRDVSDFPQSVDWGDAPRSVHDDAGDYVRLDHLHDQWHGFTFNPHLGRKALWERLGGFSGFRKERHISRHVRGQGQFTAYMDPGACAHIGWETSVTEAKVPLEKRLKNWFLRKR